MTNRIRHRRTRERRGLSLAERSYLGTPATVSPSPFRSEAAAREAWQRHRDGLMSDHGPGERPEGWWLYESGAPAPLLVPCPVYGPLMRPEAEQAAVRAEQNERQDRRLAYLAFVGELRAAEINAIRTGSDAERKLAVIARATVR